MEVEDAEDYGALYGRGRVLLSIDDGYGGSILPLSPGRIGIRLCNYACSGYINLTLLSLLNDPAAM